jgi:hypothetical protein
MVSFVSLDPKSTGKESTKVTKGAPALQRLRQHDQRDQRRQRNRARPTGRCSRCGHRAPAPGPGLPWSPDRGGCHRVRPWRPACGRCAGLRPELRACATISRPKACAPSAASSMRPCAPRRSSIQLRTTGSDATHMLRLRVERARHAFDHHHGLLQQQQLGLGAHVELVGDLQQLGEQAGHGDLAGTACPSAARRWRAAPGRTPPGRDATEHSRPRNAPPTRGHSSRVMKPYRISARKRRSFMPSRPMMPKSTGTSLPCGSMNRLPGCMSA